MKPKEYLIKYNLGLKNNKFNHRHFVVDFTKDFLIQLENSKGTINIKGFENAVNVMRMKWDAISNKVSGGLPEKLWNFFYATVVCKMKNEFFPQEMKRRNEERRKRIEAKENYSTWFDEFISQLHLTILNYIFNRLFKPVKSFKILNLDYSATLADIDKSYKELAKIHHPDKKTGNEEKMKELNEAREKCRAYIISQS